MDGLTALQSLSKKRSEHLSGGLPTFTIHSLRFDPFRYVYCRKKDGGIDLEHRDLSA